MADFDLSKITGREPPLVTDDERDAEIAYLSDVVANRDRELAALRARVAEAETYRKFWQRYAMPPKARPSCLVCGRVPEDWPPAIEHMALPSVIVCAPCVTAVRDAGNKTGSPL